MPGRLSTCIVSTRLIMLLQTLVNIRCIAYVPAFILTRFDYINKKHRWSNPEPIPMKSGLHNPIELETQ